MRIAMVCALLALLPACTRGSGIEASEVRSVAAFEQVNVGGAFVVTIDVGPETRVEVKGDDNIVPDVRTEVKGETLDVDLSGSHSLKLPLVVTITTPSLVEVDAEGAATVAVRGIQAERFEVDVSGASTAELSGVTTTLDAEAAGASTIRAQALVAEVAEVDAAGASTVEVKVTKSLDADASGASTVRYHGEPETLRRDASGASKIEAAG